MSCKVSCLNTVHSTDQALQLQEAHATQPRGMGSTLHIRNTISPGQWQPWTAVSSLLGLISMK